MKARFLVATVISLGALTLVSPGGAAAQGPDPKPKPVKGSGTPGTVPLWVESGTLGDSHIRDDGTTVNVGLPLNASSSDTRPGVFGFSPDGAGVAGYSPNHHGVEGFTDAQGQAGVVGSGVEHGVVGFASNEDVGWGVKGSARGTAVGVEGTSPLGAGVRGNALLCDNSGCTPTPGDAGQFVAGAGGNLLHGFLANFNGPGGWDEKFVVDSAGNLTIYGEAYKPGGGSWSTLSDRRAKRSIQPINHALQQLLQLRGVTYEYANPSAVHELPGSHIGMVAQDVEQVFPSWVDTGKDGYKRLTFRGFEAVAVEAVRELDNQVTAHSKEVMSRLQDLERQNAELRRAIEVLARTLPVVERSDGEVGACPRWITAVSADSRQ